MRSGATAKERYVILDFNMVSEIITFEEKGRFGKENWIYIVYKGNFKGGELKIAEPNKCLGYERYKIGEVNELSNGARELYNIVSEKYSYLK